MDVTLFYALPFSLISRLGGTGGLLRVLKVMTLVLSMFKISLFTVSQESTWCNSSFAFLNTVVEYMKYFQKISLYHQQT